MQGAIDARLLTRYSGLWFTSYESTVSNSHNIEQAPPSTGNLDEILAFLHLTGPFDNMRDTPIDEYLLCRMMVGRATDSELGIVRNELSHNASWRAFLSEYITDEAEHIRLLAPQQLNNLNAEIAGTRRRVLRAIEKNGPDLFWDLINVDILPGAGGPPFDTLRLLRAYGERPCSLESTEIMQVAMNVSRYREWRRNFDVLRRAEVEAILDHKISPGNRQAFLRDVRSGWIEEASLRLE